MRDVLGPVDWQGGWKVTDALAGRLASVLAAGSLAVRSPNHWKIDWKLAVAWIGSRSSGRLAVLRPFFRHMVVQNARRNAVVWMAWQRSQRRPGLTHLRVGGGQALRCIECGMTGATRMANRGAQKWGRSRFGGARESVGSDPLASCGRLRPLEVGRPRDWKFSVQPVGSLADSSQCVQAAEIRVRSV